MIAAQMLLSLIEANYRQIMVNSHCDIFPELKRNRDKMYKKEFKQKHKASETSSSDMGDELPSLLSDPAAGAMCMDVAQSILAGAGGGACAESSLNGGVRNLYNKKPVSLGAVSPIMLMPHPLPSDTNGGGPLVHHSHCKRDSAVTVSRPSLLVYYA